MKDFFWRQVHAGVVDGMPRLKARGILLCNVVSIIAATITAVIFAYALRNGWTLVDSLLCMALAAICAVPVLNRTGKTSVSRVLLSTILPLMTLLIALLPRLMRPDAYEFMRSPSAFTIILASAALPLLIFTHDEKRLQLFCQGFNFLSFAAIDILVSLFSKGHQLVSPAAYVSGNIIPYMAYVLLVASIFSLRKVIDDSESANELLIAQLNQQNQLLERRNVELYDLNKSIEAQNEEIQTRSEALRQSQDSLVLANREIERHKAELEKNLDEKSRDLLITNQQLVVQNNELQQFSYTVSHNLRGPVASILGLLTVHKFSKTEHERKEVMVLLEMSALSLENIITDLNRIIDIRFDKFSKFESVSFDGELQLIRQALASFIEKTGVAIETDFQWPKIQSIKAYVNSILYNLISNAIQYRHPSRSGTIAVRSQLVDGRIMLSVSDNGLGIDLDKYRGEMFKLYKRFHTSVQGGKGLGLYLVKQQVEKLNGQIDVESVVNEGTTFRVTLPIRD